MSASLAQLTTLCSQHAEALRAYLSWVAGALESAEKLPAYMGGKSLTELYIDPDVLKIERVMVTDRGKEGGKHTREESDSSPPHQEQLAPEARDIGEGQRRLREEEREVRIAWAAERDRLGFSTAGRAVIIGPPGQGKTLLARMSARQIAADSLQALQSGSALANEVALPIVVSLNAVVRALPEGSCPPKEALLHALCVALQELGCPVQALPHVLVRIRGRAENVWVLLDALDEVEKVGELPRVFAPLAEWQSHVVITSRPYGYAAQRLPFPVTEYRLAPFTPAQAEAFIVRWGGDVERQARLTDLLARSPTIAGLSQTPFLLTLLAWAGQRHEIAADTTRTRLYERIVRDLLGLIEIPGEEVDEGRANTWLTILPELLRTHFDPATPDVALSAQGLMDALRHDERRPRVLGLSATQAGNLSAAEKADFLLDELTRKRLLYPMNRARDTYTIVHKSLAEFLLAFALAQKANHDDGGAWTTLATLIDRKAWLPQWEETIKFLAGQLIDPLPLIDILGDKRVDDYYRHRLALAGNILPEIAQNRASLGKIAARMRQVAEQIIAVWASNVDEDGDHLYAHITETLTAAVLLEGGGDIGKAVRARLKELLQLNHWKYVSAYSILRHAAGYPDVTAYLLKDSRGTYGNAPATRALEGGAAHREVAVHLLEQAHFCGYNYHYRHVFYAAQEALRNASSELIVTAYLLEFSRDKDPLARTEAARALRGAASRPEVSARLIELSYDEHLSVRRQAIRALGEATEQPNVIARLIEISRDQNEDLRAAAVIALKGAAWRPEVTARLIELSYDHSCGYLDEGFGGRISVHAITALEGAAAVKEVAAHLHALIAKEDPGDAYAAYSVLVLLAHRFEAAGLSGVVSRMTRYGIPLASRKDFERGQSAWPECAVETIIQDSRGEDPRSREVAASKLARATVSPKVTAALIELVHDKEQLVRREAEKALAQQMSEGVRLFKSGTEWRVSHVGSLGRCSFVDDVRYPGDSQ